MIGGCQLVQVRGAPTFRVAPVPEVSQRLGGRLLDFSLGGSSPSTQKFQLSVERSADGGTFGPLSCGHGRWEGEQRRGLGEVGGWVGGLTHLFPGSLFS